MADIGSKVSAPLGLLAPGVVGNADGTDRPAAVRAPASGDELAEAALRAAAVAVRGKGLDDPVGGVADSSGTTMQPSAVQSGRAFRSWPLILLAVPATVAVWSGWVRLGQMTGFGLVRPLPGLLNSVQVNTAITMPIGVEAYGVYALKAWLSADGRTSDRTRRFARWSAIGSLLLGMAGQVAYHLLSEASITRAPWGITTGVACLPVLLLGMAAALTHMIHADYERPSQDDRSSPPSVTRQTGMPHQSSAEVGHAADALSQSHRDASIVRAQHGYSKLQDGLVSDRLEMARLTALRLTSTGRRVSRRALREAGLHGSNAELGALAKVITAQFGVHDTHESS